jgi:hypothetical protein
MNRGDLIVERMLGRVGATMIVWIVASALSASAESTITLAWDPSTAASVVGYRVYKGTSSRVYTWAATLGNVTETTLGSLIPGTTYFIAVSAYDSNGLESDFSSELACVAGASLSLPWQTLVVGTNSIVTGASSAAGVYAIAGAGALAGAADNFRFVYQSLSGDGEIRGRISSFNATNPQAYAGIMIRDTLTPGSRYACLGMNSRGLIRWQRRSRAAGATVAANLGSGGFSNGWVRLVRRGATFSAQKSADGTNWRPIGLLPIPMATNVYVGFAVASGSTGSPGTAVFDNVTVIP